MNDQVQVRSVPNASGYETVATAVLIPEGTLQVTARFGAIRGEADEVIGYQCLVVKAELNGALVTDPGRARRLAARAGIPEPPLMTWINGPATPQEEKMTDAMAGRDLTLLGLAVRTGQFTGHIEDLDGDERVYLLGAFTGAVARLQARVRELYAKADDDGYIDALPPLHQVMLALGADEDWHDG